MYLRNYKTDKQKYDHIYRWWRKEALFDLMEAYLEDEPELLAEMRACKTKKELLSKHLQDVWDIVCEEYSYC